MNSMTGEEKKLNSLHASMQGFQKINNSKKELLFG